MAVLLVNRTMEVVAPDWPDADSGKPTDAADVCVQACVRTNNKKQMLRQVSLCVTEMASDVNGHVTVAASLSANSARELAAWLIEAADQLDEHASREAGRKPNAK